MAKYPGGKQVKWTPAETQKLEDLKAEAIDAQISGDSRTAVAKAKEIMDLKASVRKKKQMRAKIGKGVVRITVTSKKDAEKIGTDLLKRSSKLMG